MNQEQLTEKLIDIKNILIDGLNNNNDYILSNIIKNHGYILGGACRDLSIGKSLNEIKDIDIFIIDEGQREILKKYCSEVKFKISPLGNYSFEVFTDKIIDIKNYSGPIKLEFQFITNGDLYKNLSSPTDEDINSDPDNKIFKKLSRLIDGFDFLQNTITFSIPKEKLLFPTSQNFWCFGEFSIEPYLFEPKFLELMPNVETNVNILYRTIYLISKGFTVTNPVLHLMFNNFNKKINEFTKHIESDISDDTKKTLMQNFHSFKNFNKLHS